MIREIQHNTIEYSEIAYIAQSRMFLQMPRKTRKVQFFINMSFFYHRGIRRESMCEFRGDKEIARFYTSLRHYYNENVLSNRTGKA